MMSRATRQLIASENYNRELLKYHDCRADDQYSWWEYDAQGIELERVCDKCVEVKLAKYRPEILTGYTQADVDEPIEPEWGG